MGDVVGGDGREGAGFIGAGSDDGEVAFLKKGQGNGVGGDSDGDRATTGKGGALQGVAGV